MINSCRLLSAALAAVLVMTGPAPAQDGVRIEQVFFPSGQTGTTIRDTIIGRESVSYMIGAEAGQTMTVRLNSSNTSVYFNVYEPGRGPGDQALAVSELTGPMVPDINLFEGALPVSGVYTVSVYLYRNAARAGQRADYALDVSVGPPVDMSRPVQNDYADGLMGGPDYFEVRTSGGGTLNLRAGPSGGTGVVTRLARGTVVRNLGCRMAEGRRWCRVATLADPGFEGWAAGDFLVESGGVATQLPSPAPNVASQSEMLSNCQFEAARRLGGDVANTTVKYEGQRVDGTHAINGTITLGGRMANFQCSYARNGYDLAEFWTNASQQAQVAPSTDTVRVRFPSGMSGTELTGTLTPGSSIRYVLGAQNGQFLYVRVAPRDPGLSYQIFNPDNSFLLEMMTPDREYRGQLWQSGDHVVEVINRGNATASFNVIFGIN